MTELKSIRERSDLKDQCVQYSYRCLPTGESGKGSSTFSPGQLHAFSIPDQDLFIGQVLFNQAAGKGCVLSSEVQRNLIQRQSRS